MHFTNSFLRLRKLWVMGSHGKRNLLYYNMGQFTLSENETVIRLDLPTNN